MNILPTVRRLSSLIFSTLRHHQSNLLLFNVANVHLSSPLLDGNESPLSFDDDDVPLTPNNRQLAHAAFFISFKPFLEVKTRKRNSSITVKRRP